MYKTDQKAHEMVYDHLAARGIDFTVHQEYTSDLFVGASISVDADTDMMTIATTNGVIVSLDPTLRYGADPTEHHASQASFPSIIDGTTFATPVACAEANRSSCPSGQLAISFCLLELDEEGFGLHCQGSKCDLLWSRKGPTMYYQPTL
jgi:hypothetical protein